MFFFLNIAFTLCVNDKLQLAEQRCLLWTGLHEGRSTESLQRLGFCECEFWILVLHTAFERIYLKFSQRMLQMLESYLQLSKFMKGNLVRGPYRGWFLKPLTGMCMGLEPGSEKHSTWSQPFSFGAAFCVFLSHIAFCSSLWREQIVWGRGTDCKGGTGLQVHISVGLCIAARGDGLESERSSVSVDYLLGSSRTGCPA